MITARRSDGSIARESTRGGVDLLERSYTDYAETSNERVESVEETRARMR